MYKCLAILFGISLFLVGCTRGNLVVSGEEIKGEEYMDNIIDYKGKGNLIINKEEDFKLGKLENLKVNGKEEIELEIDNIEGSYISPIIETDNFNELVASWNVNTPEKTNIELLIQVKTEDKWTMWYSYGKWSSNRDSASAGDQSDKIGKFSIDTLEVLGGKYASALKYKLILRRQDKTIETPRVRSIYTTLKTGKEDKAVFSEDINYLVELDVPERSQMMIPEIGSVICSPTSLAMVLEYYGENMETQEVAAGVLDNGVNIYGNWSYNASFAGSKGFDSYVARYNSVDKIKKNIAEGIPVIASIKTTSEDTLIGAPQTYPSGHLIVVRGFKERDGQEYIIVNDPASVEVENVRREYKVSEFKTAWRNIVYIITK